MVEGKAEIIAFKGLLERDQDFFRSAVESFVHAALEAEMTEAVGAAKSGRAEPRRQIGLLLEGLIGGAELPAYDFGKSALACGVNNNSELAGNFL
ncbi:MAG: hypothetical protein ACREC0_02945 [Methylocella sp.]